MQHASRYLLILILLAAITGCRKSNRVAWLFYDETRCADRWEYSIYNETLKQNVIQYMKSKGVEIFEMEIFLNGTQETCADCFCKTGRVFKCKVKKGDVREAKSHGFHE